MLVMASDEAADVAEAPDVMVIEGPVPAPRVGTPGRVLEVLESFIPVRGDWTASEIAEKTLAHLDETEPGLLAAWMHDQVRSSLVRFLVDKKRSERSRWRATQRARVFGEAVSKYEESSDPAHLRSVFDQTFVINEDQVRRRLGDMTGSDHAFVASSYDTDATKLAMLATFHKTLARRVGDRRTSEVMTEEDVERIYQSLVS